MEVPVLAEAELASVLDVPVAEDPAELLESVLEPLLESSPELLESSPEDELSLESSVWYLDISRSYGSPLGISFFTISALLL